MSVIEAASAGVKDMADGSLRITFEFEPRFAAEAFALFGPRGRAVAVAALKDGAQAKSGEPPVAPLPQSGQKGGEWAKLAGMWCADPDFWMWINATSHSGIFWHIKTAGDAGDFVRELCEIESRAELDHDTAALNRFTVLIKQPFMRWMDKNGIQKRSGAEAWRAQQ